MNDRPTTSAPPDGPDPVVSAALRTMKPPPHGSAFWDDLEARLAAEPAPTATVPVVPPAAPPLGPPPPLAPEPPPLPPEPPLAEVVPLAGRRSRPAPWWAAAAAALVVALGLAAVLRSSETTVETGPAASSTVPELEETTTLPTPDSTEPADSTVPNVTATTPRSTGPTSSARPGAASSVPRSPATTARASLTLSPAGVGPLRLGMTVQAATASGAVANFQDSGNGNCGLARATGSYRPGDFSALFLNGRLARFYAMAGSRLRTPQGVGVGSPEAKLSAVPGTRVERPSKYGPGKDVEFTSGNVGYQFTVDNGTVQEWSVGTTAGLELSEACS